MQRLLAIVSSSTVVASVTLQLQRLSGDAVCNDGTPSGFYYRAATSTTSSGDWLVYLPPHHWCFDEASCAVRFANDPDMMSSKGWKETRTVDGIFASGPLADANLVQLGYCTSDIYLGDTGASDATWGWHFRGEQVVRSTFTKLIDEFGLGASEGHRLVFGGSSAGARGAAVWMDHFNELLSGAPFPVQAWGFLDTPHPFHHFHALPPTGPTGDYTPEGTQKLVNFLSPGIDKFMLQGVCDEPAERWKCIYAEFRLPESHADYMIVMPRFGHEIQSDLGVGYGADFTALSDDQLQYAETWGKDVLRVLDNTAAVSRENTRVFYSPACFQPGVVSAKDDFFTGAQGVTGTTQQDALMVLLTGMPGDTAVFKDQCSTFNCGARCDAVTPSPPPGFGGGMSITEKALDTPELSSLVDALVQADLVDALSGPGPFTVFAPTNNAFDAISSVVGGLTKEQLQQVLEYHVVNGTAALSTDLTNMEVLLPLFSGHSLGVDLEEGPVRIVGENNAVTVTTADVVCRNGVFHIVDAVLVPNLSSDQVVTV